jgi:hypothetical protein
MLPKEVASFFDNAGQVDSGIFGAVMNDINSPFRAGALDLNYRFYISGPRRDAFDTLLRSRGYLTPIDKALGEGWNRLVDKAGLSPALKEVAPDLEYVMNPAIWYRALRASLKENWGKGDKLYNELARTGALQLGPTSTIAREALPQQLLTGGQKAAKGYIAPRMMKTMDDFWRVGQALRSLPAEYRGVANMGKMAKVEGLKGSMSLDDVMNVRATNIDFEMKSDWLRKFDKLSPFTAAMAQAPYQTGRFAAAQPVSFMFRTAGFMSAALGTYVALKGREDRPLDTFSDQEKNKSIFADTGLRRGTRPIFAAVGVVPEPLQPLWAAVRRAVDIGYAKEPEFKEALVNSAMADVGGQAIGSLGNLGGPIVATAETIANRSLYNGFKPIEREGDKFLSPEKRAQPATQNIYRLLSEKTGGALSPDRYKHLARGWTGALADTVGDATNSALAGAVETPSVRIKQDKQFRVDGPLGERKPAGALTKIATKLGLSREGIRDADSDFSEKILSDVVQKEKDFVADIKHWHTIFLLSKDDAQREEASRRRDEVIGKMVEALSPYGGVPDVKTILDSLSRDVMFEANVPHGRALNHIPARYRGHFLRALEKERSE